MLQTAPTLTDRELEVLTLAAKGKTAHHIAKVLGISKRTVDENAKLAIRDVERKTARTPSLSASRKV
jgi:DNA-binding NarL/FixJ family response regulator